MLRPRNDRENRYYDRARLFAARIANDAMSKETLVLGIVLLGFGQIYRKSRGADKSGKILKDYIHVWMPLAATLFINSLNNCMARYRENRGLENTNAQIREKYFIKMQASEKLGEESLAAGAYHSALEHYGTCIGYYNKLKAYGVHEKATKLYFVCFHQQGLCLFKLKEYDSALQTLNSAIDDIDYTNYVSVKVSLLNLRGLIYYKKSEISNQDKQKKLSIKDFCDSYELDKTQNSVYYFIRYLCGQAKDFQFIADNIPYEILNSKVDLSNFNCPVLADDVMLICINACMHTKQYPKAIFLLNNLIVDVRLSGLELLEAAQLHFKCARAFHYYSKIEGKELLDVDNDDGNLKLTKKAVSTEDLTQARDDKITATVSCLEAAQPIKFDKKFSSSAVKFQAHKSCAKLSKEVGEFLTKESIKVEGVETRELDALSKAHDISTEATESSVPSTSFFGIPKKTIIGGLISIGAVVLGGAFVLGYNRLRK